MDEPYARTAAEAPLLFRLIAAGPRVLDPETYPAEPMRMRLQQTADLRALFRCGPTGRKTLQPGGSWRIWFRDRSPARFRRELLEELEQGF